MYTVTMEKQCGCFKKSDYSAEQSFQTKDEALLEAQEIVNEMNETFCKKHTFAVLEEGNNLLITMEMNQ